MKNILAVTKIGTKQKKPSFRQQKINEDFHRDTLYYNEEKVKQGKAVELQPFKTVVPTNNLIDKMELMEFYSKHIKIIH